jgi:hypothetical protein
VVSAYSFLKQGGLNKWDDDFYKKELGHYDSFTSFVKGWLKPTNIMKFHHFRPQHHYLVDKYNKISVDYIGYFELIEDDFKYIAKQMNVSAVLHKQNAAKRETYQEYYDDETREIVASIYARDIALLNYDFEGIKSPIRQINF